MQPGEIMPALSRHHRCAAAALLGTAFILPVAAHGQAVTAPSPPAICNQNAGNGELTCGPGATASPGTGATAIGINAKATADAAMAFGKVRRRASRAASRSGKARCRPVPPARVSALRRAHWPTRQLRSATPSRPAPISASHRQQYVGRVRVEHGHRLRRPGNGRQPDNVRDRAQHLCGSRRQFGCQQGRPIRRRAGDARRQRPACDRADSGLPLSCRTTEADVAQEVRRAARVETGSAPQPRPSSFGCAFGGEAGLGFGLAHRLDTALPLAVTVSYGNGGGVEHLGRVGLIGEF